MNVYVENILSKASLTVADMEIGYTENMLHDEVLSNSVVCSGNNTVIDAAWGLNHYADAVAILGSNWTVGRLVVVSQGTTVFDEPITSKGGNTIIKLPELYMVSGVTLELNAVEKLEIGILFVGRRIELPLFNIGFKYNLNVNSKAERTRYGVVYGSKKTSLRSFEVSFSDVDNDRRAVMEEYIDTVQYVQPHLVEPYESPEFPPIYAALTDAGGFDKDKDRGFRWDTALSYMEAK